MTLNGEIKNLLINENTHVDDDDGNLADSLCPTHMRRLPFHQECRRKPFQALSLLKDFNILMKS